MKETNIREKVGKILFDAVQHGEALGNQTFDKIQELFERQPCCGHNCCCNLEGLTSKEGK